MVFDGGVEKSISSDDVTYELLDSDGQSAASTFPQGLSFNTTQGKISGTVTSLNYYAPKTYKIKIIGSTRIGSKVGYSNTFTLSMENNPLPDTVYDIDENNVLLGFKEGVDLFQYDGICNTMQIPVRVTSVADKAFEGDATGGSSTIPSFIIKLTFAENSKCTLISKSSFQSSPVTSVTLPSALITIETNAFLFNNFSSVDLSNCTALTTIKQGAFARTTTLKSITLPKSVTTIGPMCFLDCSSLNKIRWDLPTNYQSSITIDNNNAFTGISPSGTVESLNTSVASSQQLLNWIKTQSGFPSTGWSAA